MLGAILSGFLFMPALDVSAQVPVQTNEDVRFVSGKLTLRGTLTIPPGRPPFPAMILIAGSGSQDRDATAFNFKPFRIMAGKFASRGIAVFRYDKRGADGSGQATLEDYAEDVVAAFQMLRNLPMIRPEAIGLLGHSEGGVVAPLVASRCGDVAYLVLLSAYGLPIEELAVAQQESIAKISGDSADKIARIISLQRRIFHAARDHQVKDLEAGMREQVSLSLARLSKSQRRTVAKEDQLVESEVRRFLGREMQYLLQYDPAATLEKVKSPVLAMFAGLDRVVPAERNKAAIVGALERGGNNHVTTLIVPNANHYYTTAKIGAPSEYTPSRKEFVPGVLDSIADWVLDRAKGPI
jgi:uncharacterized protein